MCWDIGILIRDWFAKSGNYLAFSCDAWTVRVWTVHPKTAMKIAKYPFNWRSSLLILGDVLFLWLTSQKFVSFVYCFLTTYLSKSEWRVSAVLSRIFVALQVSVRAVCLERYPNLQCACPPRSIQPWIIPEVDCAAPQWPVPSMTMTPPSPLTLATK